MGGLKSLGDVLANLAKSAGLAADEMDRAATSSRGLPSPGDLAARAGTTTTTTTTDRGRTIVTDYLPPQVAPSFRTFSVSARKIGQDAENAGDAIGEAADGADDLRDGMEEAEEFFRSSKIGKMLEKLLGGFGFGGVGGQAVDAIDLVEHYLETRAELESGKASPLRTFQLQDALLRQQDFFRRLFGTSLGSLKDVARELQKFREMFPDYASDSRTTPRNSRPRSSGTLGRSSSGSSTTLASLDWLRRSGALR